MSIFSSQRHDDGFTLTEMVAVLAVVAVLMLIAIASYHGASTRAASAACIENQRTIESAIPVYMSVNNGDKPSSIDDLEPYVRTWANVTRCPADKDVRLVLDPLTLKVSCPLHPR